jgi:hypothetical protein
MSKNENADAKQSTMRIANKELQAMAKIDEIMAGLGSDAAVDRVMHWLNSTYAPPTKPAPEKQEP